DPSPSCITGSPAWMPATVRQSPLFSRLRLRDRIDRHIDAALGRGVETHLAGGQGENGVVAAQAHVLAGMPLGAALTHNNVARDNVLAAELLDAKALADGIAAVLGRAAGFFMCHCCASFWRPLRAYSGDLHQRQMLAVTVAAAVVLTAALLEDDLLVVAELAD